MPKNGVDQKSDTRMTAEDRIRAVHDHLTDPDYDGFDAMGLRQVSLISADSDGHCVFEFTVTPQLCNKSGNLHGGAAATLLDNLTSMPLVAIEQEGRPDVGHVSRTLTCTYLRPVAEGTRVRVEAELVAVGKNLANTRGSIKTLDGRVCVTCTHDKAIFRLPAKL